jgi:hypothetical protein
VFLGFGIGTQIVAHLLVNEEMIRDSKKRRKKRDKIQAEEKRKKR